jgi:hypothetical protein
VASFDMIDSANISRRYRVHGSRSILHDEPALACQRLQYLKAQINGQPNIQEPNQQNDPTQSVI